jgi:cytochrome c peroxidase
MSKRSHRSACAAAPVIRDANVLCTIALVIAAIVVVPATASTSAPTRSPALVALVALGERLFFDAALSADGRTSCASCHRPEKAFTDGLKTARGANGRVGTRNTPSLLNVASHGELFWDGRQPTLERQALEPFTNSFEHGLRDAEDVLRRIAADGTYPPAFARAYGVEAREVTASHVATALVAYQSTLRTADAPVDRFLRGDAAALDAEQLRGLELFRGRAQCAACHVVEGAGAIFTDNAFHGIGVENSTWHSRLDKLALEVVVAPAEAKGELIVARADIAALGRFVVTRRAADIGKFKTPSLRNVAVTGPYMHDGSVATLEDAVEREIYYRSHARGVPTVLTPQEKSDLVAFLRALTSD